MAFIPKNPLSVPEISSAPETPNVGVRGLYAKDDGWYDIDSDGNSTKIASGGSVDEVQHEINNIKYYGVPCVVDESLFSYNISNDYATITGVAPNKILGETLVIPYEINDSGNIYPVTRIEINAFENNTTIKHVLIPLGVTIIAGRAFYGCSNIVDIILPNSITSINSSTFWSCNNLANVYYLGTKTEWDNIPNNTSGGLYSANKYFEYSDSSINNYYTKTQSDDRFCTKSEVSKRYINMGSATVAQLNANTDDKKNQVYTVLDEGDVKFLPQSPTSLTFHVNVGDMVVGHEDATWSRFTINVDIQNYSTTAETNTTIDESINTHNTSNVAHADIRQRVKNLAVEYYDGLNVTPSSQELFYYSTDGETATIAGFQSGVEIPETVVIPYEIIDSGAVYRVTNLQGANFYHKPFHKIIIPNSVINIGGYLFQECAQLQEITIPNGISLISGVLFSGCSSLKTITLPRSITSVRKNAFEDCNALTDVYYKGSKEEWDNIDVSSGNELLLSATIHYDYIANASDLPYDNSDSGLLADNVKDAIDEIVSIMPGGVNNWLQVQGIVKGGLAKKYFNIGDSFEVFRENSTLLFDIIGFDNDVPTTSSVNIGDSSGINDADIDYFAFLKKMGVAGEFNFIYDTNIWKLNGNSVNIGEYGITVSGTATDGDTINIKIPHTMTLRLHSVDDITDNIIYDAPEATWYLDSTEYPNGVSAGTYNFTIPADYTQGDRNNKTYQFTLSNSVPSGGVIRYDWDEEKIITFASKEQLSPSQEALCSLGNDGTSLDEISSDIIKKSRYGSNKWSESAVRQWLNANNVGWWVPQHNLDRPANTSKAGFLMNMESGFLEVIKPVIKRTLYNGVSTETNDKVFLLSTSEMFGETNINEGLTYDGYGVGYSDWNTATKIADSNRIIRKGSTPRQYWTRTQYKNPNTGITSVMSPSFGEENGAIINGTYANWLRVVAVPAVVIY